MKKQLFTLTLTLLSLGFFSANAQQANLLLGLNSAKMFVEDDDNAYNDDLKSRLGFHVGLDVAIPITENLSIKPGLMLSMKGKKDVNKSTSSTTKTESVAKTNLMYLDIPVALKYSFNIGGKSQFGFLGGLYFGYGLSGQTFSYSKVDGEKENVSDKENVEWGSDEDKHYLKPFDAGILIGGELNLKKFIVRATFEKGLSNLAADTDNGNSIKNQVIKVGVGISLGKSKVVEKVLEN